MALIYHEIYVAVDAENTFDYIIMKQGDSGSHRLRATLLQNNQVYTIPTSGVAYYFKFRKPDNTYVLVEATVSDNKMVADVTEEMLRIAGTGRGEFMITSGSTELKTATLYIKIAAETYTTDDVISSSDFSTFAALLAGASSAATNANTAAAAANAAATAANAAAEAIPDDYSDLVAEVALKANAADTYTKAEVDAAIADVDVDTDTTLTQADTPADAAAVGARFDDVNTSLGTLGIGKNITFNDVDGGHYYNDSGVYSTWSVLKSQYTDLIACSEGDKFKVSCGSYSNGRFVSVLYYNNGAFVSGIYYSDSNMDYLHPITIPSGVTHVRFQTVSTSNATMPTSHAVQIKPVTSEYIEDKITEYDNDLSWIGGYFERTYGNLLTSETLMEGSIDSSGVYSDGTTSIVSDYIPLEQNVAYIGKTGSAYKTVYVYDDEKNFLRTRSFVNNMPASDEAYMRQNYKSGDIFSIYDNNVTAEAPTGYVNKGISTDMHAAIAEDIPQIAVNNPLYFSEGSNLYNYNTMQMYTTPTAGYCVNKDTGAFSIYTQDAEVKSGVSTFTTNCTVATNAFIPVEAGKCLYCNYHMTNGACYDADKGYLSSLPIQGNYYAVIPTGCAYIRVNFQGAAPTDTNEKYLHSFDECKNIMLCLVDTPQAQTDDQEFTTPYQIDGSAISPNIFDKVIPSMEPSYFLAAMSCMAIRAVNERDHLWRFGNFNLWGPGKNTNSWSGVKYMLMDLGVDFCGFEEAYIKRDTRELNIGTFLKSWQFPDGYEADRTQSIISFESFVSRFAITAVNEYTYENYQSGQESAPNRRYINCRVELPRYLDITDSKRTLSVYVTHLPISSNGYHKAQCEELLATISEDDSDFIVIMGDMNDFNGTEETKIVWRTLEAGGFRPVLPLESKTITSDTEVTNYPTRALDQFFISDNIEIAGYNIINTKDRYTVSVGSTIDGEQCLSDHDFVYCDLKFDYDIVRSGLAE